ncbi:S49 family peptidase [Moraxella caviae]|uniref:Probable protease sohB n=1 Tax=Moraxella caviae TaxID=34060 RepID=A0A1T0ABN6_9GAMM|nr:signal peptide peptidase SppA [Moraxella caviae]OOR93078.1 S49 family peptidase [Moraxella caviae]STZ10052.1 Probable protease sohB [Moraxella caviae]VEW12757.1 Probable protease sohB [Moraxella caviae]
MAWPPNPDKKPDDIQRTGISMQSAQAQQPTGQEWRLLEKTLLASIEEQRRARRWSIFFKILTFAYVVMVVLALGQCSSVGNKNAMPTGLGEPHLAVVDVTGAISANSETSAEYINTALTEAFENTNAKAVALNINSPGGSPVQSNEVWQQAMALKEEYPDKKLYAVIGDMGASGAYYIASSADEIWVNPSSLVGSIGVIMTSYNVERLLDKAGVQDNTMTSGAYKDILSMTRPMNADERAHVQSLLDTTHQNFIDAVTKGRGDKLKDPEKNQLFSGLFWTGKQSVELGLADKLGGMTQLKNELDLDTVNYSYTNPMKQLFDRFGVQVGKGLGQGVTLGIKEQSTASIE